MSKNRKSTRRIELVETGNIALAIQRIKSASGDSAALRALFHASEMAGLFYNWQERIRFREALKQP